MKLGVITSSLSRNAGGLYHAVKEPLREIASNKDVDCKVFSLIDDNTEQDKDSWLPLEVIATTVQGLTSFGYSREFFSLLRGFEADIHHSHGIWMYPSLANHIYCKKYMTPYMISPHGMLEEWAVKQSIWKKKLVGLIFENRHLSSAHCLHALTIKEVNDFRKYGLNNTACVIPNGISLPSTEISYAKKSDNIKNLLFIGRIHPKKGLLPLLYAWKILEKKLLAANWHLNIAGWDQLNHESELKNYVDENNLNKSVSFLGPIFSSQKEKVLREANAFILPSYSEGLPMSILEAWSYRLPVLMTPECNLPEAFELEAAIKVKPEKNSIVLGLNQMMEMNAEELSQLGQNGRSLVEKKYTWDIVAEDLYKVYSWILGDGQKPDSIFE